jgi:hypothetical protein
VKQNDPMGRLQVAMDGGAAPFPLSALLQLMAQLYRGQPRLCESLTALAWSEVRPYVVPAAHMPLCACVCVCVCMCG